MKRGIAVFLSVLTNAHHKQILLGVTDCAKDKGYNLFAYVGEANNAPGNNAPILGNIYRCISPQYVQGIIVPVSSLARYVSHEEFAVYLKSYSEYKIVTICGSYPEYLNVTPDYAGGMRKLIDHLIQKHGCSQIVLIRGPDNNDSSNLREQGYRQALRAHGIDVKPEWINKADIKHIFGAQIVQQLVDRGVSFDAIVTTNDSIAIAACEKLAELGIKVPQQVKVCGYQGIFKGNYSNPTLTTVDEGTYRQGYLAAEKLIDCIEGVGEERGSVVLPVDLVIRESCGCVINSFKIDVEMDKSFKRQHREVNLVKDRITEILRERVSEQRSADLEVMINRLDFLKEIDNRIRFNEMVDFFHDLAFFFNVDSDLTESIRIIAKNLKIRHIYLLRFGYKDDYKHILLDKIYVNENFITVKNSNQVIKTTQLVPKELLPQSEPFSIVIEPLYFKDDSLGYMILDNSSREGSLYEALQATFSTAFYVNRQYRVLEKATERFTDIALSSSDWLWEVDRELKFIYSSSGVLNVIGYTSDEILGTSLFDYVQEDQDEQIASIRTGYFEQQKSFKDLELVYLHKNGELVYLSISGRPIIFAIKTIGYRGLFRDITEKKQLMIEQSRFAAVGEMIGIIAHQWRQPLSNISTTSAKMKAFMELGIADPRKFNKLLDDINRYAQFLSTTIDDFRNFFRKNTLKSYCDVNGLINKTLVILDHSLNYHHITLSTELQAKSLIYANGNELMQVFLNIIKNAYDALVLKQTVNPAILIKTYDSVEYLNIVIEDNAGGVPDSVKGKIFDAYFTTKAEQKGTGLGLYVAKVIIKEHCRGSITVENTGAGARFSISLPISPNNP